MQKFARGARGRGPKIGRARQVRRPLETNDEDGTIVPVLLQLQLQSHATRMALRPHTPHRRDAALASHSARTALGPRNSPRQRRGDGCVRTSPRRANLPSTAPEPRRESPPGDLRPVGGAHMGCVPGRSHPRPPTATGKTRVRSCCVSALTREEQVYLQR